MDNILQHAQGSLESVTDKIWRWVEEAVHMLPNALVAACVLVAFLVLSKLAGNVAQRGLRRASQNTQVTRLTARVVRTGVVTTGAFLALGVLGLDKTVSSLLAGVGILGLAVGFAFQDLLANLMSGVLLAFRSPFEPGEIVETNGILGTVSDTRLSATLLHTFEGQLVWIPNKDVLDSVLTNYSRLGVRRVDVSLGVSYGDDLELAERTVRETLQEQPFKHPLKDVDVWFTEFGGSSVDLSARLWIDLNNPDTNILHARSEMIKALKRACDEVGLTIPFPIRTLDFGITGGERLRQHLTVLQGDGQGKALASFEQSQARSR